MSGSTGKEMLEYAAKAAGKWADDFELDDDMQPIYDNQFGLCLAYGRGWWNPLLDDGDSQRLAVKLHLVVASMQGVWDKPAFTAVYSFSHPVHVTEFHGDDGNAATRLAVLRAAAEIGKAML
jgi:hypothetical protein